MPLLAEELMDLTVEELINDYGCNFVAQEHWFGYTWSLQIRGVHLFDVASDLDPYQPDLFDFDIDYEDA